MCDNFEIFVWFVCAAFVWILWELCVSPPRIPCDLCSNFVIFVFIFLCNLCDNCVIILCEFRDIFGVVFLLILLYLFGIFCFVFKECFNIFNNFAIIWCDLCWICVVYFCAIFKNFERIVWQFCVNSAWFSAIFMRIRCFVIFCYIYDWILC